MKRKDKFFLHLLLFFAGIFAVALILFFFLNKSKTQGGILGQKKGDGTFQIEADQQISVTTPFTVKFIADTKGKDVNAVGLYIKFDPRKIRIINLDTTQSFCQFYPENKFDNNSGTISIACGAPNPGFKGQSTIAEVNFFAENLGETTLEVTEKSQILLNDGKGTDIFAGPLKHKLLILNSI